MSSLFSSPGSTFRKKEGECGIPGSRVSKCLVAVRSHEIAFCGIFNTTVSYCIIELARLSVMRTCKKKSVGLSGRSLNALWFRLRAFSIRSIPANQQRTWCGNRSIYHSEGAGLLLSPTKEFRLGDGEIHCRRNVPLLSLLAKAFSCRTVAGRLGWWPKTF